MNVSCLKDKKLAHFIVYIVWCQNLDTLQITIYVDLTFLKDICHLLLSFLAELFHFVIKILFCLSILDLVDPSLVDEWLGSRDEHTVVEYLQVCNYHVYVVTLNIHILALLNLVCYLQN